ncbi:hypothetical protein GDO81_024533 [Engystomops pustulosus]|uniref:Uncharacterized protein n=1 Tax=Engystomops pustulosus TaxID=76066 RepID=A0AAV6YUH3_ENGPU|nr:hypothetical protein GDO81_024533 [Engystomops pustulosus]
MPGLRAILVWVAHLTAQITLDCLAVGAEMADLPTQVALYYCAYFGHMTDLTASKTLSRLPGIEADAFLSAYEEAVGEVQGDVIILA